MANFQVIVQEIEGDIVFLHRVISGGADRSYGIEAARLAGVPLEVIKRSRKILTELEEQQRKTFISPIHTNDTDKK